MTSPEKKEAILTMAQQLFAQHGWLKTTMNDIANMLSISKALLYYYYPDKESLYVAVLQKEANAYLNKLTKKITTVTAAEAKWHVLTQARMEGHKQRDNFGRIKDISPGLLNNLVKQACAQFIAAEQTLIIEIITQGVNEGVFFVDNIEETAILLRQIPVGLRYCIQRELNKDWLTIEELDTLSARHERFYNLFLRALKNPK